MDDDHRLPMLFGIAAIVALALAVFSHGWLKAGQVDGGVGLRSVEICFAGDCESASNREVVENTDGDDIFWVTGWATFVAGLVGAGALAGCIFFIPQGRGAALPWVATVALLVGELSSWIFVRSQPTLGSMFQMGTGWSFWCFGIGAIGGIIAAQLFAASRRSHVAER